MKSWNQFFQQQKFHNSNTYCPDRYWYRNGYSMQQAGVFIPVGNRELRNETRPSNRMNYQQSPQLPYPVILNDRRQTSRQQNRYYPNDNDSSDGYDDSSSRDTPRHNPYTPSKSNQSKCFVNQLLGKINFEIVVWFNFVPIDRRRQAASSGNLPRSEEFDLQPPQNARIALRRNPSDRSSNEELKNQRPWSYINPEELPSSPNKLNQFYINRSVVEIH